MLRDAESGACKNLPLTHVVLDGGPFELADLVVVTAHRRVVVAGGGAPVTVERQFRKTTGVQRPPGRSPGEGLASGQAPVGDEQAHPGGGKKVGLVGSQVEVAQQFRLSGVGRVVRG